MLWYKAWLETRWRFAAAMSVGTLLSVALVLVHPTLAGLRVDVSHLSGPLRELAEEGLRMMGTYEGYVWSQWFGKNLLNVWTFFAVLLGLIFVPQNI